MTLNLQIHGTNSSILTANIGPNAFQHTELNMTQQFAWVCEKNMPMYELLLKIFKPTSGRLISTMNLVSNYSDCALYTTPSNMCLR